MNYPILIVLLGVWAGSVSQSGVQELQLDGTADFGKVELRSLKTIGITIAVKNAGAQGIRVRAIAAGCGCIEVLWPKEITLRPGEVVETQARLDPLRASIGAHRYVLQAVTSRGTFGIGEVAYEYAPPLTVHPRVLWLAEEETSGLRVAKARIVQAKWAADALLVSTSNPSLSAQIVETPRIGTEVRIALDPSSAPGPIDERVYIHHSTDGSSAAFELRIRGNVPYTLMATPPVLLATENRTDGVITRVIEVRRDQASVEMPELQVESTSPLITIESVESTSTGWKVRVLLDAAAPGLFEGAIRMWTADEHAAPVRVVWKGASQ